jgi:hypothetical protein
MRKFVFVAVGIISLGAAQQSSAAQKQCEKDLENCLQRVGAYDNYLDRTCFAVRDACVKAAPFKFGRSDKYPNYERIGRDGAPVDLGYNRPPRWKEGESGAPGGGGGSKPKPGTHRTADGGTVMVTPEGKEWIWNGKYTSVVRVSRPGYVETITVMQGDPDVSIYKTVDGKTYNVADPKYAAAIAKQEKEKTVVVRDHRNDKPPSPSTGGSTNGGTPSGGTAGSGTTHGAAPGSAPSTTTPGNAGVSTTANTGTVVRDHRPGGANGVSALPPSVAAPGINKKPAKNAQ